MEYADDSVRIPGIDKISDPLLGRIIAEKYQVKHLLGRGGMGSVYEGIHLLLDRPIAIKVMQADIVTDETAAARFLREAKAAAKIEHPNAITIHDFGILQDNIPYIVMEHVRGISLRQWLDRHGLCEPADAVKWLSEACNAVAAGHLHGVIHRDLKPENIMLKEIDGGGYSVKVVDFGLAKLINSEGGGRITKTNEVIGTPHYMAPEFYQEEGIDHRVDIYALGIIAYEMLCGHAPFNGTIERIIAGHLFNEVPPLCKKNIAVAAEFDIAIAKALMKDPADRFESAIDFASALKAAITTGSRRSKRLKDEAAATLPSIDATRVDGEQEIPVISKILNEDATSIKPTEKVLKQTATAKISTADRSSKTEIMAQPIDAELTAAAQTPSKRRFIAVTTLAATLLIGLGIGAAFLLGSSIKPVEKRAVSSPAGASVLPSVIETAPPITSPPEQLKPTADISKPKTEVVPIDRPSSQKKKRIDSIQSLPEKPSSAQTADKSQPAADNVSAKKVEAPKTSTASESLPKPTVEPIADVKTEKDKVDKVKKEEAAQDDKKKRKASSVRSKASLRRTNDFSHREHREIRERLKSL